MDLIEINSCSHENCNGIIFNKTHSLCRKHYRIRFEYHQRREKYKEYRKTKFGKDIVTRWNKSSKGKTCVNKYQKTISARYNFMKSRSRKNNKECDITKEEYTRLLSIPCTYCSGPLAEMGVGLDRIDNSIGYMKSNVVSCCRNCNVIRSNLLTPNETKQVIDFFKEN